jgi:dihydrofolate reductase
MRIAIVVIVTENGVIGRDNAMPWHLPDDLKRFKQVTMGKPIVMGRKTFESIGKALPGRHNIVVTRNKDFAALGCTVVTSVDEAMTAAGTVDEVCMVGGGDLFRQVLPQTDVVYLTRIHASIDGHTYFPSLPESEWRETFREEHGVDARHAYPFTFLTLERKK